MKSDVFNNDFGRIDAEFFGSIFLTNLKTLSKKRLNKISELAIVTDGEHGSPELDENSGILYLSGHNIKENYIDYDNIRKCSENIHQKNLRSALKIGNVLMSIVGTIGRASVVIDNVIANTDRNVATIKEIDESIKPKFLSVFLNSKYGNFQSNRFSTGNVQPLLNLSQIKSILVPILSQDFQTEIENLFDLSHINRDNSQAYYKDAEQLLMRELGLTVLSNESLEMIHNMYLKELNPPSIESILSGEEDLTPGILDKIAYNREEIKRLQLPENYKPDKYMKMEALINDNEKLIKEAESLLKFHKNLAENLKDNERNVKLSQEIQAAHQENINIKSFKESFGTTGRLDPEYYQKKYEVMEKILHNYTHGFEKLSIACNIKDSNFNPKEDIIYKYIELSNIGKSGEINGSTIELGKDLPSRARRLVNIGDVVISSIEGSLQSCGVINKEYNNAICSTGFYVINSNKINSETLLVLFKSQLMQLIMKKNCSGTILTGMNKEEFMNIPVPLIDIEKQEKIAKSVKESFKQKAESERLLIVAKKAVEMAIEIDEATAMRYINENK